MRRLLLLLLFSNLILLSFSFYGYAYESDEVDCQDWYETKIIADDSYWVIELLSDDDIDYIYDIIISSAEKVDFLFVDYDGLDNYEAGTDFEYNSDKSSLDDTNLSCDIPLEKNDDSIYILIDNSDKVDGGAHCGWSSEVTIWISPRKKALYTIDEIYVIFTTIFLIAMVCGISVSSLLIIRKKQKNKNILKKVFFHSANQPQLLIQQLENARLREKKETLFLQLSLLTGDSVEHVKNHIIKQNFY